MKSETPHANAGHAEQQALPGKAQRRVTLEEADRIVRKLIANTGDDGFGPDAWFFDDQWRQLVAYCRDVLSAGIEVAYIVNLHHAEFLALRGSGCPSGPAPDEGAV